jgi:hypothetical protein
MQPLCSLMEIVMTDGHLTKRLPALLPLFWCLLPAWLPGSRGHAQELSFGVEVAGATHRTHVQLTNQHVVDGALGLAIAANAGLHWGTLTLPEVRIVFLSLAGLPYHAYTAGVRLGRPRGLLGSVGAGLIQRPVQWDPIDSGDSFYTTRNRFGIAAQVAYQFPFRRGWAWAPTISWTSSFPEGDLKWRFELITVGVAVRYR